MARGEQVARNLPVVAGIAETSGDNWNPHSVWRPKIVYGQ